MARASLETTTKSFPGFIYTNEGLVQDTVTVSTSGVSNGYSAGTVITDGGVKYATTDVSDEVIGSGDGTTKTFSGFLDHAKIVPGSVSITATVGASTVTATDDGNGYISGTGVSGHIDYASGYYVLEYDTAPDNGTNITADYKYANGDAVGILLEDVPGDNSSYPARVMIAGVVVGAKLTPVADEKVKSDLVHIVFV